VVIVEPFTSLGPEQRKEILGFMQRVLPAGPVGLGKGSGAG